MNILITGGAGYIGSHAVQKLAQAGHSVVVLDNLTNGRRERIPDNVPFRNADICDTRYVTHILREFQIHTVMHFAALVSVEESTQSPLRYYRNNVSGTLSLLEAMNTVGVKRLVFSSTAAVYDSRKGLPVSSFGTPLDETSKVSPINPYGKSKQYVEQTLQDIVAVNPDFGFTIFRYFNVAGHNPNVPAVKSKTPSTHLIPVVLEVARGERDSVIVFGNEYNTSDGTCIRDYIHVDDVVDAHVQCLGKLTDGSADIYNLGIGRGYSVLDIIQAARKVTGKNIPVEFGEARCGDVARLVADASRVRRELGWSPQYTDIDEIIASAGRLSL